MARFVRSAYACCIAAHLALSGLPGVLGHGYTSMRNDLGEVIESRNSLAWKTGAGYPNPQGMSTTKSESRPLYCGGLGQSGYSEPEHDLISAPDALQRARDQGFATRLRKGGRFTLQNFLTANHGGVAALYYSCPASSVDTPEEYAALDWKVLTPIKDSFPESKRNGVGFSEKMPEWYGFAGSICNLAAGYTGGVIQTCDDCQLRYGGPETTAAWRNEKPPSGAALGTGQQATIVEIEYQLPADFECAHAVFSWMWHTPHLCIPKEVADKGAENDFWKFCNKNLKGFYPACQTEWQDEIFTNCMDAEVVGDGEAPMPSPPATLAPTPVSDPEPSPSPAPSPSPSPSPSSPTAPCVPIGNCGALPWCDQVAYIKHCDDEGMKGACPMPFCTAVSSTPAPSPLATSPPAPLPPAPATPAPTPATPVPAPAPQSDCVPTNEGIYNDPAVYGPWCKAASIACPAPMCRRASSLLEVRHHRSQSFRGRGAALIQKGTMVESAAWHGVHELEL